jgi:hypothetical protein
MASAKEVVTVLKSESAVSATSCVSFAFLSAIEVLTLFLFAVAFMRLL